METSLQAGAYVGNPSASSGNSGTRGCGRLRDGVLARQRHRWYLWVPETRPPSSGQAPVVMDADAAAIVRWRHRWYYTTMEKTTLYLPEDLKSAVKRAAAERGVSEAEIIRESIRMSVGGVRPRARGALYSSGQPIARHAEEMLAGFGER